MRILACCPDYTRLYLLSLPAFPPSIWRTPFPCCQGTRCHPGGCSTNSTERFSKGAAGNGPQLAHTAKRQAHSAPQAWPRTTRLRDCSACRARAGRPRERQLPGRAPSCCSAPLWLGAAGGGTGARRRQGRRREGRAEAGSGGRWRGGWGCGPGAAQRGLQQGRSRAESVLPGPLRLPRQPAAVREREPETVQSLSLSAPAHTAYGWKPASHQRSFIPWCCFSGQ